MAMMMSMSMAGCSPPDIQQSGVDPAAVARGEAAARRIGCAACHIIPGIDWPAGEMGPALDGFSGRARIAGQLPNRADVLTAFLRDPPSMVAGTAMPALAMSAQEAQDMALWLHSFPDE